ncbi:MAG TPA: ion transporter [Natronoarchaeum rubrum]|nr:ion transporter [Natronoarchaeum rubrum]
MEAREMTRYDAVRRRVYDVLNARHAHDRLSIAVNGLIAGLILLNVVGVVLFTVDDLAARYGAYFRAADAFFVAVFSVEYLLRVWSCTADDRFSSPVRGRLRFALTPYALIDLVAILPFFLPVTVGVQGAPRLLRVARLFRMLKLVRYSRSLRLLGTVVRRERDVFVVVGAGMAALLVAASSAMYFAERGAQPEAFSSIPAAMWWGVITLTTVGYGDVYPVTPLGRVLGGFISVLGVAVFALPTAILVEGFREVLGRRGDVVECPHCGREIDGATADGEENGDGDRA